MELKDLKPNDLVEFNFGSNALVVKGIFDGMDSNDNPVFKITSLGHERQVFDKKLVRNINILLRPAITCDYDYIKECIADNKIRELKLQIELREEQIERLRKGDFVPLLDDVFNFIDPYD